MDVCGTLSGDPFFKRIKAPVLQHEKGSRTMKNTPKQERGKNDLEIFCLKAIKYFKENQDTLVKTTLIVVLLFVAAIFAFRFRKDGASTQNRIDEAYYSAMSGSMLGISGAPDPTPFEMLEKTTSKEAKALLQLSAADAYMKRGIFEIQVRFRGGSTPLDIAGPPGNPKDSLGKAQKIYMEVADQSGMASDIIARALYGAGITLEYLASIEATSAGVENSLKSAQTIYEKILSSCPATPYVKPAESRKKSLKDAITTEYYKKIADRFTKLPDPKAQEKKDEKSILSSDAKAPLDPPKDKESKIVQEFSLNQDTKPADNAAPKAAEKPAEKPAEKVDPKAAEKPAEKK